MKKLLLFDIDGTLLRSGYAGRRSLVKAFREVFGVSESMDGIDFLGRSDPELFQTIARTMMGRTISEAEYEHVAAVYLSILPGELQAADGFHLMPGVPRLLEELAAHDNIIIGLQTGNLETAARLKLAHGGIDRYFLTGGYGSDSGVRADIIRKGIERARDLNNGFIPDNSIFIIEDTPYGIRSGHEAGVRSIAVATGWTAAEELQAALPSFFLPDLADAAAFINYIYREES